MAWMVTLEVPGTINNAWKSSRDRDSGRVTFTGAAWDASLAPGAAVSFGYCFVL